MNNDEYKYIWQSKGWPNWSYDLTALADSIAAVSRAQGILMGRLVDVGIALRDQASLAALTADVIKTSEIEGEILNVESVRSSIARRLGVDIGALAPVDRHVDGVVEMIIDATTQCHSIVTKERLFGWHAALFPTGYSGLSKINVASWRDDVGGSMQVVSGPIGRQKVHYEAPPAQIQRERKTYYDILERTQKESMDVTPWLVWFLDTLHRAIDQAQLTLNAVLAKSRFWQYWGVMSLNERQVKLLNKLLDGFEGKLTNKKWATIAKCSSDTALRDINDLLARGVLRRNHEGGRSTSYELNDLPD